MTHPRKIALASITALGMIAALGACGNGSSSSSSDSSKGPINIGAVVTISGPLAEVGQGHKAGAQLAVDEINKAGGVDGRKLKLQVKDEKSDPKATVKAVREFLGSGVKLMLGGTTDSDCLGAAPLATNGGGIFIGTSCQTNLLQTTKFVDGFFEVAPTNYMLSKAVSQVAADDFSDVKTWDGMNPDYEYGHEVWASFQKDLKSANPGVKFRKNVYVPLTETQFSSYISSLLSGLPSDSAKKNGLLLSTFSATTIGLAKQGKSFNMFKQYKTVLNVGGSTPTAEALKTATPPLYFIYDYYHGAYKNDTNTKFVDAFKSANDGHVPNAWNYEGYTAVMTYKTAIEKAKTTDTKKLIKTIAGLEVDTPKGKLTFRKKDHLLQSPVTSWKVNSDKSAPEGFKVSNAEAIPIDKVLPPVNVSK